jgi:hypothetical protein
LHRQSWTGFAAIKADDEESVQSDSSGHAWGGTGFRGQLCEDKDPRLVPERRITAKRRLRVMARILRKTPVWTSLTYSTGLTNKFLAGPLLCDERDGIAYLIHDLSPNLHTRNKQENSYIDACELVDRYSDVKTIQIDEEFARPFVEKTKHSSGRKLQIVLGSRTFTYSLLKPTRNNGSVFLNLQFDSEG